MVLLGLFLIFSLKQTLTNKFLFSQEPPSCVVFSELCILCKNGCKDEISLITKSIFWGEKNNGGKGRALNAMLSLSDKQKLAIQPKQQFCHYGNQTLEKFFPS